MEGRLGVLQEDLDTLGVVEADLAARAADLERDFQLRLSDVEKVLLDFERLGHAFFEERRRLLRVLALRVRVQVGRVGRALLLLPPPPEFPPPPPPPDDGWLPIVAVCCVGLCRI